MAAKKKAEKKNPARKARSQKATPKKVAKKKAAAKKKVTAKKKTVKRTAKAGAVTSKASIKKVSAKKRTFDRDLALSGSRLVRPALGDSDSQGLSDVESADSESVAELVDEGNIFEAGVVRGVQRADDADEKEVRTREFPEDDVPQEYLDED